MAKAKAECICKTCGSTFYKEKACYNRKQADEWEAWASQTFDEGPACWSKRKREEEKAQGLVACVRLNSPYAAARGEPTVAIVFEGDTFPYKDELKARGAKWTDVYPLSEEQKAGGIFTGLLATREPPKRWVIYTSPEQLEAKIDELKDFLQFNLKEIPSQENILIWKRAVSMLAKNRKVSDE